MLKRCLVASVLLLAAAGAASASTVLGLSIEDQVRLSDLVVLGEVVSLEGVVHPEQGIETAVTLKVSEALKGAARPGDLVVFHTRSGQVGDEISEAVGEAVFRVGQKTLVLVESIDGRLYNLGLSMGVWDVLESRGGRLSVARALQDGLNVVGDAAVEMGPLPLRDLARRVTFALDHTEFDEPMLRDARVGR